MCTGAAPTLPTVHAQTIYIHLTRLLQEVLTSHRRKLQGHFHILIQTLIPLLQCLFVPLSTTHKLLYPPPPWLPNKSMPSTRHLSVSHAEAYARIITLICAPTVSAVSRHTKSSSMSLNNPTAKAKRHAAQHMPVLLSAYIHMQLDVNLQMKTDVRQALVPAVYAIFDIMGKEERRALGEGMDAGGRAVLSIMIRDWARWGKWKGN
jgi:nucleolar pre-ribosomal-associated protein 2